jgi:hypothetical protein
MTAAATCNTSVTKMLWMFRNAIILAHTQNIGNAVNCTAVNGTQACIPVSMSCDKGFNMSKVDNNPGTGYRSVPRSFADPTVGQVGINLAANAVEEVTFSNFDNGGCYQVCSFFALFWLNFQPVLWNHVGAVWMDFI